ncbi:MAG: hypothetical protein ACLPVY_17175 [Acidimicrobiia bacterium]
MGGRGAVGVVLVVALFVPMTPIGASTAAPTGGSACRSFVGNATLTPGLPKFGDTRRVKPTISIEGARLHGCPGRATSGTVSATLKFAKPSNCKLLITQVSQNIAAIAKGTLTITWDNKMTSTIALTMSFGSVPHEAAVAIMAGTVEAGLYQGLKESWTVLWTMRRTEECFGGAPLTSLAFSKFAAVATKA